MGNIFMVFGILLMVLACVLFTGGYLLLRKEYRELEEYLYLVYGKGGDEYEMSKL